jgi:antitoxin Phd
VNTIWQLQEAKNKLSHVVDQAIAHGPQVISRRGVEAVVVLGMEDYKRLAQRTESLVTFFQQSPLRDVDLDLTRSTDTGREVEL